MPGENMETALALLAGAIDRQTEVLTDIRADLKRRSARELEASGAIPQGSAARAGTTGGVARFPNYGKSKNQPVKGATPGDLDYYANGCRRTLNDPEKMRYHDNERALLAAIEAEMRAQEGGGQGQASAPDAPDFGPPPDDSDTF